MQVLTGMYDTIYAGVCDDAKPWRDEPNSVGWQKGEAYDLWWREYDAHCNSKPRWHFDEFQHAFLTIFQVLSIVSAECSQSPEYTQHLLVLVPTPYLVPTTHHLPLTTYHLLFAAHCSLLTAHCSLLTTHCSLLTTCARSPSGWRGMPNQGVAWHGGMAWWHGMVATLTRR